jgi:hypothetical protein
MLRGDVAQGGPYSHQRPHHRGRPGGRQCEPHNRRCPGGCHHTRSQPSAAEIREHSVLVREVKPRSLHAGLQAGHTRFRHRHLLLIVVHIERIATGWRDKLHKY